MSVYAVLASSRAGWAQSTAPGTPTGSATSTEPRGAVEEMINRAIELLAQGQLPELGLHEAGMRANHCGHEPARKFTKRRMPW